MFAAKNVMAFGSASIIKGSVAFDGSGDYLSVPYSSGLFGFGTGDFTVESWIRPSDNSGTEVIVSVYTPSAGWWLRLSYASVEFGNGDSVLSGKSLSSAETWTHVAITRSGTNTRFFFNGTQSGAAISDSTNYTSSSSSLYVGALSPGTGQWFQGNISNLRIVKGTALYTANFTTPTAPLSDVSGTSLLTCQNPSTIVDNSTNAATVTASGNAAASSLSPF